MGDETTTAIGMSVGATSLVAVGPDRIVIRKPVVAADGSDRRGEQLLADGLHALAYAVTDERQLPEAVAVTYPGHWSATAADALREALSRVPEWSEHRVAVISDVGAAVTALRSAPGLPDSGVIAVCDFGGSGTSVTLVDTADGDRPVGDTVRHSDLSGEMIDQALLNYVVADLTERGSLEGDFASGALNPLRGQCRNAKEQLSTNTVTELAVDLPGFHGDVWLTRAELDGVIRQPLESLLDAVQHNLESNHIENTELAAVAAVGGGASIPLIGAELSQRLGVPVISSPQPQLTAATGAALEAGGSELAAAEATVDVSAAPAETPQVTSFPVAEFSAPPESVEPFEPFEPFEPQTPVGFDVPSGAPSQADGFGMMSAPPPMAGHDGSSPDGNGRAPLPWHRRQLTLLLGIALAVLVAGLLAVIALRHVAGEEPSSPNTWQPTTSTVENPSPQRRPSRPPAPSLQPAPTPQQTPSEQQAPSEQSELPEAPATQYPEYPTTVYPEAPSGP